MVRTFGSTVSRILARTIAWLSGAPGTRDARDLLEPDTRIIEAGVTSLDLARALARHGGTRYLGVATTNARARSLQATAGTIAARVVACRSPGEILKNNADTLILSGGFARRLWTFSDYAHARLVAFTPRLNASTAFALLGLAKNAALRRIAVEGVIEVVGDDGRPHALLVARVLKRAKRTARRYLSPVIGVKGFFERLNAAGVRYAVLRWFETLPEIAPGEDIDLLVDDEDVETVQAILDEEPGTIPCDLYTVSGLPGTSSKNMAYYPPPLARQILDRARPTPAGVLAPCPEDHLLSMAYHALYHKGERSGIPPVAGAVAATRDPEHDYVAVLERLAAETGHEVEITLQGLEAFLGARGWRPPRDMLVRLALTNRWLERRMEEAPAERREELEGLVVFFIRERAVALGLEERIVERLREDGFTILHRQTLSDEESARVASLVRGGNWGQGPWPVSGGPPRVVVVGYDLIPSPPTPAEAARYPTLENRRILVKIDLRDEINETLAPEERCNVIHSSDNHLEALHYLEAALPGAVERVTAEVTALRARFDSTGNVRRVLTHRGRRAKVEVIEYRGGLAVRKTFRPGFERFAEREAFAMRTFSPHRPEIPPLLEAGSDYVIFPYYQDAIRFTDGQILPLWVAKQCVDLMRFFWEQGYSMIDFQPSNLLIHPTEGLKVFDFEFLHRYETRPATFEACYELAGLPDDFDGDRPRWGAGRAGGYRNEWEPFVGLDLRSLLDDPTWLQHLKRTRSRLARIPRRAARAGREAARKAYRAVTARQTSGVPGRVLEWVKR